MTPKKSPLKTARAANHMQRQALQLLPKDTPISRQVKGIIRGLGFTAEFALEETKLQKEIVRELRSNKKIASSKGADSKVHYSHTRTLTSADLERIKKKEEEKERQEKVKEENRILRQKKAEAKAIAAAEVAGRGRGRCKRVAIDEVPTVLLFGEEDGDIVREGSSKAAENFDIGHVDSTQEAFPLLVSTNRVLTVGVQPPAAVTRGGGRGRSLWRGHRGWRG